MGKISGCFEIYMPFQISMLCFYTTDLGERKWRFRVMYLLDDIALHRYTFQSIFFKLPFSENK